MTEKSYHSIEKFFIRNKFSYKLLRLLYKALPAVVFVSYGVLLLVSFIVFNVSEKFLKITFVPLFVYAFISVFRRVVNFPRPYEKLNITPLISKDKKGHSFPSRHTASAFIIAMAFLYVSLPLGIAFLVISCLIALSRVLAGVHFIKDVIAGAVFSLIIGLTFLFLI